MELSVCFATEIFNNGIDRWARCSWPLVWYGKMRWPCCHFGRPVRQGSFRNEHSQFSGNWYDNTCLLASGEQDFCQQNISSGRLGMQCRLLASVRRKKIWKRPYSQWCLWEEGMRSCMVFLQCAFIMTLICEYGSCRSALCLFLHTEPWFAGANVWSVLNLLNYWVMVRSAPCLLASFHTRNILTHRFKFWRHEVFCCWSFTQQGICSWSKFDGCRM